MKFRIISFHFRFSLVPKYNSFFWMLIFLSCFNAVCLFDECFFAECLFSLAAFMQYAFLLNAFLLYAYFSSCFFAVCFSAECLCAVCFSAECFSAECFFVAQPKKSQMRLFKKFGPHCVLLMEEKRVSISGDLSYFYLVATVV